MKTRVQIALMAALGSILLHLYLTMHYYPLRFGFAAGQSLCNLSAKFDCDAVSASPYSALFGVPLSLWGLATNLVLFGLILLAWLEWSERPERLRRWALLLSGLSVVASLVMGLISLFLLHNFCLFCIFLYVLSVVGFFAYLPVPSERPLLFHLGRDLPELTQGGRGILIAFALIPVIAVIGHQMYMANFSDDTASGQARVSRMVSEALQKWEAQPKHEFVAKPSLTMGAAPESAKLTLIEFADFRCSHCKHASYTLDAFVKSHPDVRFEFYTFALDGACNEKIQQATGISCRLAHAVVCADKTENKGWALHHALFEDQERINQSSSVGELDVILSKLVSQLGLNWESLQTCMQDSSTQDAVKAQSKQGALVDVRGTPTIFANGRQLDGGQLLPVLEGVHRKVAP